jgi:hypothetical protein
LSGCRSNPASSSSVWIRIFSRVSREVSTKRLRNLKHEMWNAVE